MSRIILGLGISFMALMLLLDFISGRIHNQRFAPAP